MPYFPVSEFELGLSCNYLNKKHMKTFKKLGFTNISFYQSQNKENSNKH